MTRVASGIVAVVVLSTGTAYGQGQAVSLYADNNSQPNPIKVEIPQAGFVLTGIVVSGAGFANGGELILRREVESGPTTTEASFMAGTVAGVLLLNHDFGSGIRFDWEMPSVSISVDFVNNPGAENKVTLTGYIPTSSGAVPAVGVWGLLIMVLLIVGAGSVVFRRMRMRVAA